MFILLDILTKFSIDITSTTRCFRWNKLLGVLLDFIIKVNKPSYCFIEVDVKHLRCDLKDSCLVIKGMIESSIGHIPLHLTDCCSGHIPLH
jgi:hypothetical protein